jgi:hypothetical protein
MSYGELRVYKKSQHRSTLKNKIFAIFHNLAWKMLATSGAEGEGQPILKRPHNVAFQKPISELALFSLRYLLGYEGEREEAVYPKWKYPSSPVLKLSIHNNNNKNNNNTKVKGTTRTQVKP